MWKWANIYGSHYWSQPVVTSFPFLKQSYLKAAKVCVSPHDFHVLFQELRFVRSVSSTEIARQALLSLWIFHLRSCLISLFLSSWICSPWRSQVVISRAGPLSLSPSRPLSPPSRPCGVWSRARGGRPDIQPRLWRPSLSVPCTLAPCCEAWRKSCSQENYKSPHLLSRG